MRAWKLTAGLVGGIAATSVVLYACGTDENGTCSDTLTCGGDDGGSEGATGDDGSFIPDGGADAAHHDGGDAGDAGEPDGDAEITDAPVDVWDGYDGFTCDPSQPPASEPCVISDEYGVFVAPGGSSTAAGTEAAPVNSIATALTLAQSGSKHLIFVCGGTYAGAVSIASSLSLDVAIYGGLACPSGVGGDSGAGWSYTGAATTVSSGSNAPALTVQGTTHAVRIEDIGFVAGPGVNPGDSSIAGWIANAGGVALRRVAFVAQNGVAQGLAPAAPENHYAGTLTGNGLEDAGVRQGAAEQDCTCVDGTTSIGGGGGNGGSVSGQEGSSGGSTPATTPMPPANGAPGAGAMGLTSCGIGFAGALGAAGGAGAGATTYGTLTASSWTPAAGAHGTDGDPGQGGGGGGGTYGVAAVGGGGGACGGCGGGYGQGGAGGGSSFALVVVASTVTIMTSTFTAGNGGNGGQGSAGENGQAGGLGGTVPGGCGGGNGAAGAGGGGGGGGAGGCSVGIAWTGTGTAISIDGTAVSSDIASAAYFTPGTAGLAGALGAGGLAASGGVAGTQGDPGVAGAVDAVKQF